MSELRVLEPGEIEEHLIFCRIYIAAVKFYLGSPQHSDQTCVYRMPAPPIKDSVSVFEKFLTTLKNANLTAYDRKISGVGVKVTVFFDLGLDRIELQ
jgi:hypothetical protein